MPSRSASLGASALPRPSYDTRRSLVGVMHGRNGWSVNGPVRTGSGIGHAPADATAPEPGFRSPWGELERQIPYVTITTQPFPRAWWTPPELRAEAATRATAHPAELIARPVLAVLADPEVADAGPATSPTARVVEPVPEIQALPEFTEPVAEAAPRRAPRSAERQRQRRGFFTRLAIVAVGLVVSLICVEMATRERS